MVNAQPGALGAAPLWPIIWQTTNQICLHNKSQSGRRKNEKITVKPSVVTCALPARPKSNHAYSLQLLRLALVGFCYLYFYYLGAMQMESNPIWLASELMYRVSACIFALLIGHDSNLITPNTRSQTNWTTCPGPITRRATSRPSQRPMRRIALRF